MTALRRRIRDYYRHGENVSIGQKFIEIIEVIYALVLACGVVKIVDVLEKDNFGSLRRLWPTVLVATLFLLRFFFAPSKNLKKMGEEGRGWKWSVLPFDGTMLIVHSFLFYYMCLNIASFEVFFRTYFILLILNSFWLLTILLRLKGKSKMCTKIWCVSNAIFFALYVLSVAAAPRSWQIWFGLAVLNSLFDLITSYPDYLSD